MKNIVLTRCLFLMLCLYHSLYAGEREVVRAHENQLYTKTYKKLVHTIYQIKKKEEQLAVLTEKLNAIKKENALKEKQCNHILKTISRLPLPSVLFLQQEAHSVQAEQSINSFSVYSKKWQEKEANDILDTKQ